MRAVDLKEASGIGLFRCSAGDAVGDFVGAFPGLLLDRLPFDHEGLSDVREVEVVVECGGGPDLSGLDPPMLGREARSRQLAIFPEDRIAPRLECEVVQIKLSGLQICAPRQWGACWLACELWEQLQLDGFWSEKLPLSRKGTRWLNVFKTLVCYRLIDPGSEWRLHRQWYERSAMADLLGEDFGLVQIDKLYRCLDKLLGHKKDFFTYLKGRWESLFQARIDVLLYDLTSTYFECAPPEARL